MKYTFYLAESSPSEIPKPGQFFIPHSLAFVPALGQLCVADRENGRIQCFTAQSGEFLREIRHPEFGERLFAVSYTPNNGNTEYCVSMYKWLYTLQNDSVDENLSKHLHFS